MFVLPLSGEQRKRRLRSIKADVREQKISKKALPAAVLKSFEEHYPTAAIKGQAKETREGVIFYEIESVDSSISRHTLFESNGTIAEVEESISINNLPQFIQDSVKAKYPLAVITSAESITRDNHVEYELALKTGTRKMEIIVSPNGKIFKIK